MTKHQPLTGPGSLQLILTCSLALAPFLATQAWPFSALAVLLLLWRLWLSRSRTLVPPRVLLVLIGLFGIGLSLYQFKTVIGKDAGLAMLSLLLPLKLLETRSSRDARVAMLLACFLLTGQFLIAQTMAMASLVLICTLGVLATTAQVQQPGLSFRKTLSIAARLVLTGIPMMLVLFLFFPRVDGPLWRLPIDAGGARTGLSDSMTPGSISSLIQSGEIVFRASFEGEIPPPALLYWRALVLNRFDGRTWEAGLALRGEAPKYPLEGKQYRYTLTLEAQNQPWLLALDYPAGAVSDAYYMSDYSLRSARPVVARKRFTLSAYPHTPVGIDEGLQPRAVALSLPENSNPRTQALGRRIATQFARAEQRVEQGIQAMQQARLLYTLSPPTMGLHAADEFLFDNKKGFCEHFASAFVVMMRAANVPARVVTGYQGGELNPIDGTLVIRQSDAHAWAEVWLADRGWVRIDPTAASAPRRIDQGIGSALPAGEALPLTLRANLRLLTHLRYRWEAINNGWNQWVLGYNADRQLDFMRRIGIPDPDWSKLAALLGTGIALWMAWLALQSLPKRPRRDPLDRCWQDFCRRLGRHNIQHSPWESVSTFTHRAQMALPAHADDIARISEEYAVLRYGRKAAQQDDIARLRAWINAFNPSRRS
jgi:transglutaminase-like putative cysteine protease